MRTPRFFRHQIALTLTLFSAFLSLLFGLLVGLGLQKSDDNIRQGLLASHAERLLQDYRQNDTLWARDQLSDIEVIAEGRDSLPASLEALPEGYSEDGSEDRYVYVLSLPPSNEASGRRVYLVHHSEGTDWSEQYEALIYLMLLAITLLVITVGSLIGLMLSRKLSEPLQTLTTRIQSTDPRAPAFTPLKRRDEFGEISLAFANTIEQINRVLEREKQFSRYASHELRTPVAIVKSSLDLWQACQAQPHRAESAQLQTRAMKRIAAATQQMEDVIQTFLLLGKEQADWDTSHPIPLHELLDTLIDKYQAQFSTQQIRITKDYPDTSRLVENRSAATLALSNVLRNAFAYCASEIDFNLDDQRLRVVNDIDSLRLDNADHFGFGIKIIEELCRTLQWRCDCEHTEDGRFKLTLVFR